MAERIADVRAQAGQIQMRGRRINRDIDQLADFRPQRAVLPWHRGKPRSVLGIHTITEGVPLLLDEAKKAGA
jgi:hypothetical protein